MTFFIVFDIQAKTKQQKKKILGNRSIFMQNIVK